MKCSKSLYSTGSFMDNVDNMDPCRRYMKPGEDFYENFRNFHVSCGCTGKKGCRELQRMPAAAIAQYGCKPSTSMDCKKAIHNFYDSFLDVDQIDSLYCWSIKVQFRCIHATCNPLYSCYM